MKALIVSSGHVSNYDLLKNLIADNDYIVCADGGLDHLIKVGEIPNVVIGDLDSISNDGIGFIKRYNIETIKYPVMKDKTDTELALLHLINKKIQDITFIGVTGSRMDHTIANIFLLKGLKNMGIKAKIVDDNNSIYYINNYFEIEKQKDKNLSIIPISQDGIVVTLEGVLFLLKEKYIPFGSTLGLSNKVVEDYGKITIHSGEALLIESKD